MLHHTSRVDASCTGPYFASNCGNITVYKTLNCDGIVLMVRHRILSHQHFKNNAVMIGDSFQQDIKTVIMSVIQRSFCNNHTGQGVLKTQLFFTADSNSLEPLSVHSCDDSNLLPTYRTMI